MNNAPPNPSNEIRGTSSRSSIDLSLELERQLDSESFPPDSPRYPHGHSGGNRTSLDPQVLAHIVTQLRESLTNVYRERDDLVQQLAESHSREAEFKDTLALCTERCASLENDLEIQRKKNQDDEEAIVMLRSKVEESRRGLMRLQSERNAENKRMTLDLTHARTPSFGGSRSSQRASFTPLTGSGQPAPYSFRRPSSTTIVGNDLAFAEFVAGLPGGEALVASDGSDSLPTIPSRRRSVFSPRASNSLDGRSSPSSAELDALKRELAAVRAELEETRHELSESNEAREANETCVNALRAFIAQSNVGAPNVQLPPLPTDLRVKDVQPEPKPKGTGWGGLKLWRVDTGIAVTSKASASTVTPVMRNSVDSHGSASSEHENTSPSTAIPLRNKFGAFFTRGTSISSIIYPPQPLNQDQYVSNDSDVSYSTEDRSEPTSPAVEMLPPILTSEPHIESTETDGVRDKFSREPGDTMKVVSL